MLVKLKNKFIITALGRSIKLLSSGERQKILFVALIQIFLGLLDLLGVVLIGLLTSLAITGIGSNKPGNRVTLVINWLNLESLSLQSQVTVLGFLASFTLISKTIFSVIFNRKITFFLSRRSALISTKLVSKVLSQSLVDVQEKSLQQTLFLVTNGVDYIIMGIISVSVFLFADISLLIILSVGLFIVDPLVAASTFVIFSAVAYILYRLLQVKSQTLGKLQIEYLVENSEKTIEVLTSYRELVVRNRRSFYAREIGRIRLKLADVSAEKAFMPFISKYVLEVTLVIGSLLIAAIQFVANDAARAMAVLSVFIVASSRIVPAVLRMQQGALVIKSNIGGAKPTLELIEKLSEINPIENFDDEVHTTHIGFNPIIELDNISFKYPDSSQNLFENLSLKIVAGSVTALVGPSGAGKTTLVDLILGVIPTKSGKIEISKLTPLNAIDKWPGAIGYVPQNVVITNGSIKENIALGFKDGNYSDNLIWDAIKISQLEEFVKSQPLGINSQVGDRGTKISGGQRQRLGIARAMFTKPTILVLDEATSSLDGVTESSISEAIQAMKGQVTIIMIAHRLSTVRQADTIVYLDSGKVLASGSFEEVRKLIPNFDSQAKLMGL